MTAVHIATPAAPVRSPFTESGFRRLFLAHTVSVLGDRLAPVVLAVAMLDLSASVSDLGLVIGAHFLTVVALPLAGGAIGDRVSRRALTVGTHLMPLLLPDDHGRNADHRR